MVIYPQNQLGLSPCTVLIKKKKKLNMLIVNEINCYLKSYVRFKDSHLNTF